MQNLITLVRLLSAQKIKQIEIITEDASMSPKTKQLYEGLKEGKFETDDQAAKEIYGTNGSDPAFKKLKYRLQQRLVNTVFFIDVQEYSNYTFQKVLNRSIKNWSAFKILLDKGARSIAIELAENVLKQCNKYDMVELKLFILKDLIFQYGLFIKNDYKLKKYKQEYTFAKKEYEALEKAEQYYVSFANILIHTKNYQYNDEIKKRHQELEEYIDEIREIDSYFVWYYAYNALYFINLIKKDNQELSQICSKAIDYFESKGSFLPFALFSFYQKRGITRMTAKKYDEAEKDFNYCFSFKPTEGTINWQYLYSYIFNTKILRGDYQSSYDILSIITNHKAFKKIPENYREPWYLKEAFINFLVKTGKIDPEKSEEKKLRPFRLSRFINEVPVFQKDKRGLNITINIIQMLFLIVDEKYDAVLDKLSALKQYNFRYLKRPEYARPSNFIKMLQKIPEGDYNAHEIQKKAAKYHQALLDNPMDFSEHSLSIEIIPYEQLWEEILSIFGR